MRTIVQIDKDLEAARNTVVQGSDCEVHARIVGYYRAVKNWNAGKKSELRERVNFKLPEPECAECVVKLN